MLLCVALVGVGWYAKCQIFLLIFLVIAMTSVVLGAFFPRVPDEADNAAAGGCPSVRCRCDLANGLLVVAWRVRC